MMKRPLLAVLRGIKPDEAIAVGDVLLEAGIDALEVTLNSPDPLETIRMMNEQFGDDAFVGAGTVLAAEEVEAVAQAGGKMIVSPSFNESVVTAAKQAGLMSIPGVFTPSECFSALDAGADALKLFPASMIGVGGLKAYSAVLPENTICFATGGVGPDNFDEWLAAGLYGFGIGGNLYKPGAKVNDIKQNAIEIVSAFDDAVTRLASS